MRMTTRPGDLSLSRAAINHERLETRVRALPESCSVPIAFPSRPRTEPKGLSESCTGAGSGGNLKCFAGVTGERITGPGRPAGAPSDRRDSGDARAEPFRLAGPGRSLRRAGHASQGRAPTRAGATRILRRRSGAFSGGGGAHRAKGRAASRGRTRRGGARRPTRRRAPGRADPGRADGCRKQRRRRPGWQRGWRRHGRPGPAAPRSSRGAAAATRRRAVGRGSAARWGSW
jgi:hypothetical protein